jgi:glyoxylase-like metal-dependent hydrolase (beta-lactamase superfamily II)
MRHLVALLTTALLTACGSAPPPAPSAATAAAKPAPKRPARHEVGAAPHGDARIGTFVSDSLTFDTSAYWIEGPDGLVLIDTGFLSSGAVELVERAEKATGKKASLAVVLHANPDKFNGTAVLQARGVRVVTSAPVAALIPAVHAKRVQWFGKRYAPDYPMQAASPDVFGDTTTEIEAAGLSLTAHVLGAGCSAAHVAVMFDGHLFVGDLVAHGNHGWLELGLLDEWMATLDALMALNPRWVHPGRGESGGPELLTAQKAYLADVKARVAALAPAGEPDATRLKSVRDALVAAYPGYGYPYFVELGLPAIWRQMAAAQPAAAPAAAPDNR